MMLSYIFLLIVGWLNPLDGLFHPLHLSISELVLNPQSGSLEISQRIFIDDLEAALKAHTGRPYDLSKPANADAARQAVGEYLEQHFKLQVNGKAVKARYLGYEVEEDVVWAFMEVKGLKKVSNLRISHTLFFDRFTDQVNIITVTVGKQQQSLRIDARQPEGNLSF